MRTLGQFKETSKKVEFTMHGWDGTGYNGEGVKQNIWTCADFPEKVFVCKYMSCYKKWCVLEIRMDLLHEETGLPTAMFRCSFERDMMKK